MFDIILKRKVYEDILKWKQEYAPNYVLFLKGARRVGKTTLAELVGKNEYESYMKISFDNASSVVKDMFVEELNNLNLFYQKLLFFLGRLFCEIHLNLLYLHINTNSHETSHDICEYKKV